MSSEMESIDLILQKSGEMNKEDLTREISLLIALSKRDKYQLECRKFEHKYQMNLKDFERMLHSQSNREDYTKESDLDDWEFAISSRTWWEKRIEEILNVSN